MADRGRLRHERAQRDAHYVSAFPRGQGRYQRACVVGHVLQAVGRLCAPRQESDGPGNGAVEGRGAPDVTVVVANHPEPAAHKLGAEIITPPDELEAHSHHEKDEGSVRGALFIDAELDPLGDPDGPLSHRYPCLRSCP